MRHKSILILIALLLIIPYVKGQQTFCADSSYRVKYIFGTEGASIYNNPDTSGINIFTGAFTEGSSRGLALLKTNWGDSLIWAKKVYMYCNSMQSFKAPQGTIICSGSFGGPASNQPELLLSRIDTNGTVLWVKKYKLSPIHLYYWGYGNSEKNILIANNSIYLRTYMYYANQPQGYKSIVSKLDLSGNIIWSKSFEMTTLTFPGLGGVPIFDKTTNSVLVMGSNQTQLTPGPGSERYTTLTRLNDTDGSIIESYAYKTVNDTLIKGFNPSTINLNPDNTISFTGFINFELFAGTGQYITSNIPFNSKIDIGLNPIYSFYYKNDVLTWGSTIFDFNNLNQNCFLSEKNGYNFDKYFVTFDKNFVVKRSRKFTIPSNLSSLYNSSINLDDKQNIHFLYHYPQGGKTISEYARISNFAPSGTLGCFGKDTSILTRYPFNIIKEPFTWDVVQSNILTSTDVPYTEDTAIVTKELVCKIVSYCDSIHIDGPDSACIGQPVRYSITKNNGCFKNLDWVIDTSFANIISTEGDSAITLSFKKAFSGYIHAAITDCVVKDSFFVTVIPSPVVKLINPDSLLCPGKIIVLNASPGFAPYLWQDGSSGPSYTVTIPGFYKVTGTSYCTIQSSDSILIKYPDTTLNIPVTQTICKYDTAYVLLPADVNNITWQPTANSLLNNKTLLLYPAQNTFYSITAERLPNCPITENAEVLVKTCPQIVFIPNSFTPNGDGLNDMFRAIPIRSVQYFSLAVYNRYGQKLFETHDPAIGWDGTINGKPQPVGGYTYYCRYRFTESVERNERGYFLLIR